MSATAIPKSLGKSLVKEHVQGLYKNDTINYDATPTRTLAMVECTMQDVEYHAFQWRAYRQCRSLDIIHEVR